jgi:beta-N-acetylhexosaminidase
MISRKFAILATACLLFSVFSVHDALAQQKISLKQKIGQMIMVGFPGKTIHPDDAILKSIQAGDVGGVILFDYNFQTKTYDKNIESPEQVRTLIHDLQHDAQIPLFVAIDYEGGRVNRLKKEYGFPDTLSAAAFGKLTDADARVHAVAMAKTLKTEGINLDFAPVTDVNINPDNPIIGKMERSFSADPDRVTHYARIFSKAFHDEHIFCSYKHFPGHGSSAADSHLGFVDVTETWQPEELLPYEKLLNHRGNCGFVMIAHVINGKLDDEKYPASLSKKMITDLLRRKLHFKGVVVADDLQMKAISDHYGNAEAIRLAINAGVDLLIFGNNLVAEPVDPAGIVDLIWQDVQDGKIPESRIDDSWRRIMKFKKQLVIR